MAFVGKKAPDFIAQAYSPILKKFKEVTLKSFAGKYLLLNFYPLDFTFVCPTEIKALDKLKHEFNKRNCEILVCSTDSQFSHKAFVETAVEHGGFAGHLSIDLLSDFNKKISRDYGVLIEEQGFALRGSFLIDPEQKLRHVNITDTNVGRNMDEFLRLVDAFDYAAKNGEVCPANWKKVGDPTLVGDADDHKTKQFWKKSF